MCSKSASQIPRPVRLTGAARIAPAKGRPITEASSRLNRSTALPSIKHSHTKAADQQTSKRRASNNSIPQTRLKTACCVPPIECTGSEPTPPRIPTPSPKTEDEKCFPLHSQTIMASMETLWRQNRFCDVTLYHKSGRAIRTHKSVLVSCSQYFLAYFLKHDQKSETTVSL